MNPLIQTPQNAPDMDSAPMQQQAQNPLMQQPQQNAQPPDPAQLQQELQHTGTVIGLMGNLLGKQDIGSKDVLTMFVDAMRHGAISPQRAAQLSTELPADDKD